MQTFKKEERLTTKKIIEELMRNGSSFSEYPFKVVYLKTKLNTTFPAQVVISVPKKNFKKAVTRNKLKRRMREAYRRNKFLLYQALYECKEQRAIMLIYIAKAETEYKEIESKISVALHRLVKLLKS